MVGRGAEFKVKFIAIDNISSVAFSEHYKGAVKSLE